MVRIFEASGVQLRVRTLPDSPWFLQLATLFLRFVLWKMFAGGNEWKLDLTWADFRFLIRAQGWKRLLKVTWFSVYLVCSCRLD